jgi:hypothetical protein
MQSPLLAHQYHSDHAIIEQVQEIMKELNRLNSDKLSAQSVELLRWLFAIEMGPPEETCLRFVRRVSVEEMETEMTPDQDNDVVVSVHIPYLGVLKISREGMRKEAPQAPISVQHLVQVVGRFFLQEPENFFTTSSLPMTCWMRRL